MFYLRSPDPIVPWYIACIVIQCFVICLKKSFEEGAKYLSWLLLSMLENICTREHERPGNKKTEKHRYLEPGTGELWDQEN